MLQHAAAVAGRVVDEFGNPATGAFVMAARWGFMNGQRQLQSANSAMVDDRGEYRVYGIQPGQYVVAVEFRNAGFGDTSARTVSRANVLSRHRARRRRAA